MKSELDSVVVSACRTPLGTFQGSLADISATELGASVIKEAVKRANLSVSDIDEVIMGMVLPCQYGQNPARQAAIKAGIPLAKGALTINKVCGSGLMAVALADQYIKTGFAEIIAAGGMENMSAAPHYLPDSRHGIRMGTGNLIDHMVHDGLWDVVNDFHMGETNDIISLHWGISREDQDSFALESYRRAIDSIESGRFVEEIVPVEYVDRKKQKLVMTTDQGPRPTNMESLAQMKPAFRKDGFATAGNSSIISDGASALIVTRRAIAQEKNLPVLAKIVAYATAGIELEHVLMAPVHSIPRALKKAGLSIHDIELHEINEAFSGSTIGVIRELNLSHDKVNVNGGSVALGHPIGASGARVLTTLLYEMKKRDLSLGQASLCLGGGEAVTMIVEME
ncbi:MAG: acetyl-CoA C-acetyltransferase [Syntrophales bacterium]|jgi:acetyl-CoA C-acetyltransferase|nr:acetyl-CoA C-acetyltransferase [Syntrophales bacterium]MDY0044649.1 acetyl-CoA C-acetyltransferase [Syntrophales bacterium]